MSKQEYSNYARGEAAELITFKEYNDNMRLNPKMTLDLTNQIYQYYGVKSQVIVVISLVNTLIRNNEFGHQNE